MKYHININNLYAKRTAVKRTIGSFNPILGLEDRKAFNVAITKTDLFFTGITQLFGVLLDVELHDISLTCRIRNLAV